MDTEDEVKTKLAEVTTEIAKVTTELAEVNNKKVEAEIAVLQDKLDNCRWHSRCEQANVT